MCCARGDSPGPEGTPDRREGGRGISRSLSWAGQPSLAPEWAVVGTVGLSPLPSVSEASDSDPRRIGCRASESLCISPAPAEVKNHSVWSKWVWRRCRHAQGTWMGVPGGMRRGLPAMQVLAWCPDPVGLGWAVTPVTRCVLRSCWCRELDSRLGSWVSSAAIREPEAIP